MKIHDILGTPAALTAAAHHTTPTNAESHTKTTGHHAWKKQAWAMYDQVGELRKVTQWLAQSLSRVPIYAADVTDDGTPSTTPTENPTAQTIVRDIAGGPAGQAKLLRGMVPGLTIVGEVWVAVIHRTQTTGTEVQEWHALSAREISTRAQDVTLKLEDGTDHALDPERDLLVRVHRPHPEASRESDSPVRAALQPLHEIMRTSAAIEGAGKSRLAGNGILALPQEMTMPVQQAPRGASDAPGLEPVGGTAEVQVTATDIMRQLQQVMTTAVGDPSSAAALVPIVLKAPGEHLDKIRHITFQSEVTEVNLKTREAALARLARSLDVPPEVMTGLGGTNHWNAWAIDDDAINNHIAPLMTLICDALTEALLRPLLASAGMDPSKWVVWFDTTPLTQKANRTEDAVAAFDRGAVSVATLRRELGFADTDAPTADTAGRTPEQKKAEDKQLATELVKGSPALLPLLAHILELPAPPGGWGGALAGGPGAPGAPPAPPESRDMPDEPTE